MELAEIIRLIQESHCRLLALTGQGGIGKTQLAKHVASVLVDSNPHGVVFVSLAPIMGREQIVTAVADALGIVLYTASDRSRQLVSYLHRRELLLILDNFEHLTGDSDCIDLIDDILQGTHKVKIIVTSREPLKLQADWVFEVQGLPLPKSDRPEELEATSAGALFIQRANQASVGFKPTEKDVSAIVQICQLVEGLPLGIELAASWVRTLTCEEIAREIQRSLNFLKTSERGLPERHRSMRATIEHTWKLLDFEEQRALRQLSIFRGKVRACNSTYGTNGWLGLPQIWVRGSHITQATAKMNDSYLASGYTETNRQHVICQEIGHDWGLDHQDESGADLNTCMDYDENLGNAHPNAYDYEQLELIYSHLDGSTTLGAAPPGFENANVHAQENWGAQIHASDNGRSAIFERDFGNGNKIFTFVIWAE